MTTRKYIGNCVALGADFIWKLRCASDTRTITLATFQKHTPGLKAWAARHGYDARAPGLTLARDTHVTYHKATVQGHVCYWLIWSGFEHVWAPLAMKDARAGWMPRV